MLPTSPNFHVHPETGAGRCRAHLHACPFSTENNHFITDEEEVDFTEGDCGILARAINRKTGWPLVLVSPNRSGPIEDIEWEHMAVRAPDGRIIDAVGMRTEIDFHSYWGRSEEVDLTEISGDQWDTVHSWGQRFGSNPTKVANRILKSLASLGLYGGGRLIVYPEDPPYQIGVIPTK